MSPPARNRAKTGSEFRIEGGRIQRIRNETSRWIRFMILMPTILRVRTRTRIVAASGYKTRSGPNRPAAAIGGEIGNVISWNMWSKMIETG